MITKGNIRFYIESKAWANLTDDLYKKLLKQFYKHADTKLLYDSTEIVDDIRQFKNNEIPNLHYELRGSAFTTKCGKNCNFQENMLKICRDAKDGVFAILKSLKFDCDKNITFNIVDPNVHPITN